MEPSACGDIVPGCGSVSTAEDEAGVLARTRRHAVEALGAARAGTGAGRPLREAADHA